MAEWEFHLLRPLWLWALVPAALIIAWLWRQASSQGSWQDIIAADLLAPIQDSQAARSSRWPLIFLGFAWALAVIAMAGPAVDKLPQPSWEKRDALVILLDLSPSMYAQDIKPSRLVQAKREVRDILRARREGMTALIAYAGDAHVVTPLTDDTSTIELLLSALSPGMMPMIGNQPIQALELAAALLAQSPVKEPRVLMISDEIPASDFDALSAIRDQHDFNLSILGVGTEAGAPIPVSRGGFLKNRNREVVVSRLNEAQLKRWANSIGARYRTSHFNEQDTEYLLRAEPTLDGLADAQASEQQFDAWRDAGPWLIVLLLPFGLLAFRRGWLLGLGFICLLPSQESLALDWQDLWLNRDQQGQQALRDGQHRQSAELFNDPAWKGSAWYRAQDYGQAFEQFKQLNHADGLYNTGNALAKMGKYPEAIAAYNQALNQQPDHQDAAFNKQLLEQLQQQQQQQGDQGKQAPQDGQQQKDQQGENSDQGQAGDQQNQGEDGQSSDKQGQQQNKESRQEQNKQQEQSQLSEQQQQQIQQSEQQQDGQPNAGSAGETDQGDAEMDQWLRQISDNPGELLQRKFEYQSRQHSKNGNEERY